MGQIKKYVIALVTISTFISIESASLHPTFKKANESLKKTVSYLKEKYHQHEKKTLTKKALILTTIVFASGAAYMIYRCRKKHPSQDEQKKNSFKN